MFIDPPRVNQYFPIQVFLDPLGQVVGSTKSKSLLLSACTSVRERNRLQSLGCLLGVAEWTRQIADKCLPPEGAVEDIPQEEAEEFFHDVQEVSSMTFKLTLGRVRFSLNIFYFNSS